MKKINIKKLLLTSLLITFICVFLFVGWVVWEIINNKPPEFFPLDDPDGKYTILKSPIGNTSCEEIEEVDRNWLNYYKDSKQHFVVRYEGKHVFSGLGKTNCLDVYVGNSKANLEKFIWKQVEIKGKWAASSKQCIVKKCQDISGPFVVLDIDKLEITK